MIEFTMLGTSALAPLPERGLTAAALTCDGHTLLFDCGEGTQTAARKYGISLLKIDIIALTHYHGDHIFGLPGILQSMFVFGRRTEPLFIIGPRGLKENLSPVLTLAGELTYEIKLIELSSGSVQLCSLVKGWPDGARLSAFPTLHRVPSCGYCFNLDRAGKFIPQNAEELNVPVKLWSQLQKGNPVEVDGKTVFPCQVMEEKRKGLKVVFSGDTTACDSLAVAAENADITASEHTGFRR